MTFLLGHAPATSPKSFAELEDELAALKLALNAMSVRVSDLERRMHVPPELIKEIEDSTRESEAWRREREGQERQERSHRDSNSETASPPSIIPTTYDPPASAYDPPAPPDPTPSTIDPGGGSSGGGGASGDW